MVASEHTENYCGGGYLNLSARFILKTCYLNRKKIQLWHFVENKTDGASCLQNTVNSVAVNAH